MLMAATLRGCVTAIAPFLGKPASRRYWRVVEVEGCGGGGMWRWRDVEVEGCGGVWRWKGVEGCGGRGMWKWRGVEVEGCGGCEYEDWTIDM